MDQNQGYNNRVPGEAEDVYMSSSSNTVSEDEDCNNYSQLEEQEDESEVENYDENLEINFMGDEEDQEGDE